jgi:hypothetical protein
MYAITVEDRKTHLRTVYLCGCEPVVDTVELLGSLPSTPFKASSFREISLDIAEAINAARMPHEQELVDKVNVELGKHLAFE